MATKKAEDVTTEVVKDKIMDGRSITARGRMFKGGEEADFAKIAKGMHPDDLQLLANRGDIVGFGTEFVEQDDLDREATHPFEYAEGRKAEARAKAKEAPKAGTAEHLKRKGMGASSARETDEQGRPDGTEGDDSQRRAPAVPAGEATGAGPDESGAPPAGTEKKKATPARGKGSRK